MTTTASARGVGFVTTAGMTVSMLPLFVLGALGPLLVPDYGIPASALGFLVAAGFLIATLLSVPGGALVDRIGPRRCSVGLFVISGGGLALIAAAQGMWTALVGVALAGVPQAIANPATNKAIIQSVPVDRRAGMLGLKQSGVQLGALVAGAPLAGAAVLIGWRAGVAVLAGCCVVLALLTVRLLPADQTAVRAPASFAAGQLGLVRGLAGFSAALGFGTATVNTYLSVYASARLGMSAGVAGTLVAVLGVAGIVGRIGWNRVAGKRSDVVWLLTVLSVGAVVSTGVVLMAMSWTGLVWLGAAGFGVFAVAANAVSMLIVVNSVPAERAGQSSALVSAGFFAGFAMGPLVAGVLVNSGYGWVWSAVAAAFALAAVISMVVGARCGGSSPSGHEYP